MMQNENPVMSPAPESGGYDDVIETLRRCAEEPEWSDFYAPSDAVDRAIIEVGKLWKEGRPVPKVLPHEDGVSLTWDYPGVKLYRHFFEGDPFDQFVFHRCT